MGNTGGGNENTPLQGNLLRGVVNHSDEQIQVEIGSGDEERLLPTDLLNDPEDECINENPNHPQKPVLRKTWSWTPLKDSNKGQEELLKKKQPEGATIRHLERAIKCLSIDPNVSISRKF